MCVGHTFVTDFKSLIFVYSSKLQEQLNSQHMNKVRTFKGDINDESTNFETMKNKSWHLLIELEPTISCTRDGCKTILPLRRAFCESRSVLQLARIRRQENRGMKNRNFTDKLYNVTSCW